MKKSFKIIWREFRHFFSNPLAILIFIGGPILYSFLIGFVYKDASVTELPIMVVDLDNTPLSNNIIDALEDNQYLKIASVKNISENLRNEVVRENYYAVVTIPDRFEADIQQKRRPEIDVDINAANMLTANYVSTGIQTVLGVLNAGIEIETLKKKGMAPAIAEQQYESFKINVNRYFNPSSNYLYFLWPGMLGTVMQQVFLLVLALSFGKEYEEGTFGELLSYSKSSLYLIIMKSIPYLILGFMIWVPLISVMFPLFKVSFTGQWEIFIVTSGLFIISLTFMGTAASVIFNTQLKSTEVLMVIATPSFIISGYTWPLQQMPEAVQWVASCIPLTHYLEAFRKILLMQANYVDILPQLRNLFIISIGYLILTWMMLKIKIRVFMSRQVNK
jgi:ABC-2 type transport system permease protein